MVGPELTSGTLEAIAALTGTDFAPPLGSHPAVGKLVAIRYGAALADPQVAAMVARGKTAAAHSAASNGDASSASHAETPPAIDDGAEAPPTDPAEAPPADETQAQPASGEGTEAESASTPPAGTSAK